MTDVKDTTEDRTAGYNTEGSTKVEDVDDEDYGNGSDDDTNNFMGVYGMFPNRKRKQK